MLTLRLAQIINFIPDFMTRVEYVIREWELPCGTWEALPKTLDARLVKLDALR